MNYDYIKNIDKAEIPSTGTMEWFESTILEINTFIVREVVRNGFLYKSKRIDAAYESLKWLEIRYEQLNKITLC